jgi:lipoate-protein ligase A
MSDPIRLVDTGLRPARWNIAMTAALVERHGAGEIADTLRFHRYPRSVLLGRNQTAASETNVAHCVEYGIEIARRVTGGGAVYMSPGILAWDIVLNRRNSLRLADAAATVGTAVAQGLSRLGVFARYHAPNAVVAGGRKISGSSGNFDGPTIVLQGTVVIDFDRTEMARVLLSSGAVGVVSLADLLGHPPDDGEVRTAIGDALSEALCRPIVAGELTFAEQQLAASLLSGEIGTDAFVFDESPLAHSPIRRSA